MAVGFATRSAAPHANAAAANEEPFGGMARQINKLLDQMHKGYYGFAPSETWTPNVNLYELDGTYLVCVDLAGVDKDKIDIVVVDGRLTLRGTREVPRCPAHVHEDQATDPAAPDTQGRRPRVHLMEIDHGAFCREVELPHDVNRDRIAAVYRDGMLWIELPKK